MKTKMFKICCPKCNSEWMVCAETLVNKKIEKKYHDLILDGSFFNRKCSKCGNIVKFYYDFIYQDVDNKVILLFNSDKEISNDNFNIYKIKDEKILLEYIKILDNGENIENIFNLKQKISNKYTNIEFEKSDNEYYFFTTLDKNVILVEKEHI